MGEAVEKYIPLLTQGIEEGKIKPKGPCMFIYNGVTEDMTKPFTLDIGWCVDEKAKESGRTETPQNRTVQMRHHPLHRRPVQHRKSLREAHCRPFSPPV